MAKIRALVFCIQGGLTVLTAGMSIWLAIAPPTDDVARAHLIDTLIALVGLTVVAIIVLSQIERHRDEATDRKLDTIMRHVESSRSGEVAQPVRSEPQPRTLREAGLQYAHQMRDFINGYDGGPDDFLTLFWGRFPFREYDDLKQRFANVIGRFHVRSSTEWLPLKPDDARSIANNIEEEAIRVPPDVLR